MSGGRDILKMFASGRMTAILALGFASGLPVALCDTALVTWMRSEGVDLTTIGLFALVGLPYTLKFLWAPVMDRFIPPFLGRRRGWVLLTQVALVLGIALLGIAGVAHPAVLAAVALAVAFFSASQDIVVDAYRTEVLNSTEYGAGAAVGVMGWRLGWLCSSSLTLVLAQYAGWQAAYLMMAACMFAPIAATLLAPEPSLHTEDGRPCAPRTLADAVVKPFAEFVGRHGILVTAEILLFIFLYKLDWVMVYRLTPAFLVERGLSMQEIGWANAVGVVTTIAGGLIGGGAMAKLGILRSLWIFGLTQGLAGLSFALAAVLPGELALAAGIAAVAVESLCTGMATAAFVGFIMSLCNRSFTATQYALLSAVMTLGRTAGAAPTGAIAKWIGWPAYFLLTLAVAAPGLLLLLRYRKWMTPRPAPAPEPVAVN